MRPEALLLVADELIAAASADAIAEARCRVAARTAYYAVFHKVALHLGVTVSEVTVSPHAAVRREMMILPPALTNSGLQRAKISWQTLYLLRIHADYDLARPFSRTDAVRAVGLARSILGDL